MRYDRTMDGSRPFRLYRDRREAWIAGIAAGMADYAGIDVRVVRVAWVLALIFFTPPAILAYLVMIFVIPAKPEDLYESDEQHELRRKVHLSPGDALREAWARMREAEDRLGRMEAAVLSEEFRLRRKFRDL
ncbi:PspC domain-containing protein [Caenispirillum salinarum]|uniref:PspC domain-containing protein n=1 Tax=Caenispirillum salinarum TaxID=859058 RepID=UPI003850CA56